MILMYPYKYVLFLLLFYFSKAIAELVFQFEKSMEVVRLHQRLECLKVFSRFRIDGATSPPSPSTTTTTTTSQEQHEQHERGCVASILGLPLPTTISLWPCIPAPLLGQSLSLTCRLVNAVSKVLYMPLPHCCFPTCPPAQSLLQPDDDDDGTMKSEGGGKKGSGSSRSSGRRRFTCGAWPGIGEQTAMRGNVLYLLKPPWYCDNSISFRDEEEEEEEEEQQQQNRESDQSDENNPDNQEDARLQQMKKWRVELGDSAFSTAVTLLQTTVLNLCIRAQVKKTVKRKRRVGHSSFFV
jgi:hypothetical protein